MPKLNIDGQEFSYCRLHIEFAYYEIDKEVEEVELPVHWNLCLAKEMKYFQWIKLNAAQGVDKMLKRDTKLNYFKHEHPARFVF